MQQYRPQQFQILPPVIKNLLIINGILFLATQVFEQSYGLNLVDILGLHYPTSEAFKPWQFISYMFMHGSFSHIFFNMFALWMFGSALENYWGSKKFLQYYIFCGIGAAATHYAIAYFEIKGVVEKVNIFIAETDLTYFNTFLDSLPAVGSEKLQGLIMSYNELLGGGIQNNTEITQAAIAILEQYKTDYMNSHIIVGASGSVFGLLLAFGMIFPNSLIYIYFFIPLKAKYFVVIYGLLEFFSGIAEVRGDNVAHFAHLGGMFFGFILLLIWRNNRKRNLFQ